MLFLLSLKAAGTGLNLTAANHVVHFDRWWNPAVEDQATDRAFRIGQSRNVQVRKFICTGTLEDYKACHALMDQYRLVPLSAYGKTDTPAAGHVDAAVDMKTPVRDQVHRMDANAYFTLLASLMKDNPPAAADKKDRAKGR